MNIYFLQVQIFLYSHLATEFSIKPLGGSGLLLRDIIAVPQLLFILKEHYSLVAVEGEDHLLTTREQVRPYLLLIIKEFITKVCEQAFTVAEDLHCCVCVTIDMF